MKISELNMMQIIRYRNLSADLLVSWGVATCLLLFIFLSCSDNQDSERISSPAAETESFTFFDLGKATRLTSGVRKELSSKLGRDAIERRSILDLEINYPGFLKKYFPDIDALNQKLNFPPRERVEHNTIKLMYRYGRTKNVPFDIVELVFSDYTKNPIFFKISFKTDEANTTETLKQRYGQPKLIDWEQDNGKSMAWEKSGDHLILSLIPNRFGSYDHQIVIYYIENIKLLLEMERKEKQAIEEQRAKSGNQAF